MKSVKFLYLSLCIVLLPAPCFAGLILSFESSDRSWVGLGESHTVSPSDGYIFSGGEARFDNSVRFTVASLNSPFGPEWDPRSGERYNYWTLDLAAPFDQILGLGLYENTSRYPFQNNDQPGLTFSGNHRGNNRNAGFFEVLEISFDYLGNIGSLAVDFTQYGEANVERWINGKFRFNSDVPISAVAVPQPSVIYLLGLGVLGLLCKVSNRARCQ
jgi:hypothetical protein